MCRGSLPASDWQVPGARVPGPLPFRPVDLGQALVVVMREACVPGKLMPPHARSDGGKTSAAAAIKHGARWGSQRLTSRRGPVGQVVISKST